MKYLKSFNESFDNKEELNFFSDVEDILLEIKDEDFDIQIIKNEDSSDQLMESEGELIRIYIEKFINPLETISYKPTDVFINTFDHLVSYSKENEYSCSMEIVEGSSGVNEVVAYSEFEEDDMSVKELLDVAIKAPINYIKFIIYKPE